MVKEDFILVIGIGVFMGIVTQSLDGFTNGVTGAVIGLAVYYWLKG